MTLNLKTILILAAAICFAIDALKTVLKINTPINWTPAGFCLLTITLLIP